MKITGLYTIIDTSLVDAARAGLVARELILGGARIIQLRAKDISSRDALAAAREIKKRRRKPGPFLS